MITSETNPKIKYVRRLQRDRRFREREGVFVIEGTRWMQEVVQMRVSPAVSLATAGWLDEPANAPLIAALAYPPLAVTPTLMALVSDTQTPAGILAVVPQPDIPLPAAPDWVLILDAIRDPGNLGTLLRTAAAAGVDGVLLAPGCVDAFNPKVVRSSMGALLRLPVVQADWAEIRRHVAHLNVYLAAAGGTVSYTAVDWTQPAALLIGSEAAGAGQAARALAEVTVSISMQRETESLNAAVAASIIMFEAVRQRTSRKAGGIGSPGEA